MRRWLRLLAIVALVAAPEAFGASDIPINPVPPGVKPRWTKIPGTPQVSWAPNLPTDVFRYGGNYYFLWENYFYRGAAPEGPWKAVEKVPEVFYQVNPAYFKTVKPAAETPAAPQEAGRSPKAKIIEVPPAVPPAQPPAEAAPPSPSGPVEPPPKPPKVM